MKKAKKQVNADLPAHLQVLLNGLNEKHTRKLQKTVLKIVRKMSGLYADLLDKEVHAATVLAVPAQGTQAAASTFFG